MREPTPLAERWIGRAGCAPKSVRCKAKTADSPGFEYAGPVASPELRPDAFSGATLKLAQESWRKFANNGQLPMGFTLATTGRERGLVRERGQLIHADYDLMALNRSDDKGKFLPTSPQQQEELFRKVHVDLNTAFGTDMIQHGAEFMWTGGVGARASEYVIWFGPRGTLLVNPTSMPKHGH